jgi:hypothetical protein
MLAILRARPEFVEVPGRLINLFAVVLAHAGHHPTQGPTLSVALRGHGELLTFVGPTAATLVERLAKDTAVG